MVSRPITLSAAPSSFSSQVLITAAGIAAFLVTATLSANLSSTLSASCGVAAFVGCLWIILAGVGDLVWPVRRGPHRRSQIIKSWIMIAGGVAGQLGAVALIAITLKAI